MKNSVKDLGEPEGFLDRETGGIRYERIWRRGLFHWMYNSTLGRKTSPLLFGSHFLHRLVALYCDLPISRYLISALLDAVPIQTDEMGNPQEDFRTFNEFFTRRPVEGSRPIDENPDAFVSPGDGKLLVFPEFPAKQKFPVKGIEVDLEELTGDSSLTRKFEGGSAMVLRVYLGDCHRVYFPADGLPREPRRIKGEYYCVSPFQGNDVNFYCRNHRTVTEFETDRFGLVAFIDIGGFLISSIKVLYTPGKRVKKGQEKSCFAFGGSSLVVLMEQGRIRFCEDLLKNSSRGMETYVKLGTCVGTAG